jgi:NAD(P)-dependent dehydrogenase (short-subunit alcohol dehydrogenase family)
VSEPPVAVVFGARNVGLAVVADRLAAGWRALAVARTDATLERVRSLQPEARTACGDVRDAGSVREVLEAARRELGGLDLVVNAASAGAPDGPFGGGPLADAPDDRLDAWLDGYLPGAWNVLRAAGRAMAEGGGGTVIQVAGGSSRRGLPGRGPWGAASAAARALTQSAAHEMRPSGVHVALLILDGVVATDRNPMSGRPPEASMHPDDAARAVAYLAAQTPRGWTHELMLTPALETWVP